jgi:hypothetical protein
VRVGKDGTGVASRYVIDNFDSYALGHAATVASPPWTAHAGTTEADIVSVSGNNALAIGSTTTSFVGASLSLPSQTVLDNGSTATYFFRINSQTDTPNHSYGLADQASTGTVDFSDFEAQVRVKSGSVGTFALDARNGGAFSSTLASGLALNTWYNIWMVVNQATDKYDLYMNTGTAAATSANKLNSTQLSFRNGTGQDLTKFLAYAGAAPVADGVRIDDLIYQSGTDLSNPEAGFNPGLTWVPETMSVSGNYTQNPGATLQLNLQSPASHDLLHVSGSAVLGGTLNVTFALGAAAPHIGDVYHVLDAGSTIGAFSTVQLPSLSGGLAWDSSRLYSTGSVSIFSGLSGDFTQDGVVDIGDVQAMMAALADPQGYENRTGLSDFALATIGDVDHDGQVTNADLQALLNLLAGGGGTLVAAVPEPATAVMSVIGLAAMLGCRRVSSSRRPRL